MSLSILSFTSYLNSIHLTLKFTSNQSSKSLPFLDVNVVLNNGTIETDLYTKPTDKHQYLLHSSCHPHHTNELPPSVFSSDFDVSVLPTRPSHFVPTNLKHIPVTNADAIYISLTVNFNAFVPLHAQKHLHPKTFLLTNLAVFPL